MLALMERALTMLQTRSFAELSVAELCAAEGCTIGSFYARFESKEAFLCAVQHAVVTEARRGIEARLTAERFADLPLRPVVARLVAGTIGWSRRYEGLIRASLRAVQDDPAAWSPLRELGRLQAERASPILLAKLGRPASKADADKVRFAFQVLFGTLNNMVLVNPGPFTIHDAATPRLLTDTLTRLIEADS
jgi:AcrR family transcriptional regulator